MGILDQAIREIALEKQAAEDEARQALEDFDIITARAIDSVKKMVASLQTELQAAGWWTEPLSEDVRKPEYLSLSFRVRRYANPPELATNPDYVYSVKFDAWGGAIRTTDGTSGTGEPLLEPLVFRAVARQDFGGDLETDLKLFLKAILYRHQA
jgi:hypothetical protein